MGTKKRGINPDSPTGSFTLRIPKDPETGRFRTEPREPVTFAIQTRETAAPEKQQPKKR